jgi:hypothetical protein
LRSTHQNDLKHKKIIFKKIKKKLIFLKTRVGPRFQTLSEFLCIYYGIQNHLHYGFNTNMSTVPSLPTIPTQKSLYIHPSVQATSHKVIINGVCFFSLISNIILDLKLIAKNPLIRGLKTWIQSPGGA